MFGENLASTITVVMRFQLLQKRVESMNNVTATIAMKASPQKSDGTSPVVTLKAIFEQLAETHALPKKQVGEMMPDLVTAVTAWSPRGAKFTPGALGCRAICRTGRSGRSCRPRRSI
jgi:hypothetical protein